MFKFDFDIDQDPDIDELLDAQGKTDSDSNPSPREDEKHESFATASFVEHSLDFLVSGATPCLREDIQRSYWP